MIVVDTNIIAHFWLPSDNSELCDRLFQQDPNWVAPLLWKSEFRNVVLQYLRKGFISLPEALQITEKAENQMKDREFHVNSIKVYDLANQSGCTSYDSEFISLADDLDIKLVTLDRKLLRSFPERAAQPQDILKE